MGYASGSCVMTRAFDFTDTIKQQARLRQHGLCACCGALLDDLVEHAHHVVPNQSGHPGNVDHLWLKSAENCVVLCDVCHLRVHENGRYRAGAVAPPDYFNHSHGHNTPAHRRWSEQLQTKLARIWT